MIKQLRSVLQSALSKERVGKEKKKDTTWRVSWPSLPLTRRSGELSHHNKLCVLHVCTTTCAQEEEEEQLAFTAHCVEVGAGGRVDSPDPPVFTKPRLEDENDDDDIFGRYSLQQQQQKNRAARLLICQQIVGSLSFCMFFLCHFFLSVKKKQEPLSVTSVTVCSRPPLPPPPHTQAADTQVLGGHLPARRAPWGSPPCW